MPSVIIISSPSSLSDNGSEIVVRARSRNVVVSSDEMGSESEEMKFKRMIGKLRDSKVNWSYVDSSFEEGYSGDIDFLGGFGGECGGGEGESSIGGEEESSVGGGESAGGEESSIGGGGSAGGLIDCVDAIYEAKNENENKQNNEINEINTEINNEINNENIESDDDIFSDAREYLEPENEEQLVNPIGSDTSAVTNAPIKRSYTEMTAAGPTSPRNRTPQSEPMEHVVPMVLKNYNARIAKQAMGDEWSRPWSINRNGDDTHSTNGGSGLQHNGLKRSRRDLDGLRRRIFE